jgi:hypothetical protein
MTAEEIVNVIGYRKATKLFLHCGGQNIHVPKKPKDEHAICRLIGIESTQKLAEAFAGELIFVPRMSRIMDDFLEYLNLPKKTRAPKRFSLVEHQKRMFD